MIRWSITTIFDGTIIIQYDKRFNATGKPLWLNLTPNGAPNLGCEKFDTVEEAQQAVELLINDFGGYLVDKQKCSR